MGRSSNTYMIPCPARVLGEVITACWTKFRCASFSWEKKNVNADSYGPLPNCLKYIHFWTLNICSSLGHLGCRKIPQWLTARVCPHTMKCFSVRQAYCPIFWIIWNHSGQNCFCARICCMWQWHQSCITWTFDSGRKYNTHTHTHTHTHTERLSAGLYGPVFIFPARTF